jgi:initiation factor 1A
MVNKKGGSNYKKAKKERDDIQRKLELAGGTNANCYYGQIIKKYGINHFEVMIDGEKQNASIRGNMFKKVWLNPGNIVLVNYDLGKYMIVHKYNDGEEKKLRAMGEINFDGVRVNRMEEEIDIQEDEQEDKPNKPNNHDRNQYNPYEDADLMPTSASAEDDDSE